MQKYTAQPKKQISAEKIAQHFGARWKSNGKGGITLKARCPLHDDKNASLSITLTHSGKLLCHCFAGCDGGELYRYIWQIAADTEFTPRTFAPKPKPKPQQQRSETEGARAVCVAKYEVLEEYTWPAIQERRIAAIHERHERNGKKDGCPWTDARGNYRGEKPAPNELVLWLANLAEVLEWRRKAVAVCGEYAAPKVSNVCICEGEKAAQAAAELFRTTYTEPQTLQLANGETVTLPPEPVAVFATYGATVWPTPEALRKTLQNDLVDAESVAVWPDNDPAGYTHAAELLHLIAREFPAVALHVVQWQSAPPKADAADLLATYGAAEWLDRVEIIRAAEWLEQHAAQTATETAVAAEAAEYAAPPPQRKGKPELREIAADIIAEHERGAIELWSDGSTSYITIGNESAPLESKLFRQWLNVYAVNRYGAAIAMQTAAEALRDYLEHYAKRHAKRYATARRYFYTTQHNGEPVVVAWLSPGKYVAITPRGWNVVDSTEPYGVKFVPPVTAEALPEPERGGDITELWKYCNVPAEDRAVVLGWLIGAMAPQIEHPLLLFAAPPGHGKSVAAKTLKTLIDPDKSEAATLPPDERDAMALFEAAAAVVYCDNVSNVSNAVANVLCKAATKGTHTARKLYTNAELYTVELNHAVMLTSTHDAIQQADLLDRAVIVEPQPLATVANAATLWREFERARPKLYGALCDLLAAALRAQHHGHSTTQQHRLQSWFAFAAGAIGTHFERAALQQRDKTATITAELSPLVPVLQKLLETRTQWTGTAAELLTELNAFAPEHAAELPKTAHHLSAKLNQLERTLTAYGIAFTRTTRNRKRQITLSRIAAHAKQDAAPPMLQTTEAVTVTEPEPEPELQTEPELETELELETETVQHLEAVTETTVEPIARTTENEQAQTEKALSRATELALRILNGQPELIHTETVTLHDTAGKLPQIAIRRKYILEGETLRLEVEPAHTNCQRCGKTVYTYNAANVLHVACECTGWHLRAILPPNIIGTETLPCGYCGEPLQVERQRNGELHLHCNCGLPSPPNT
jgi:Zn finger protein HypA/HybF involved in hydrogenase expression